MGLTMPFSAVFGAGTVLGLAQRALDCARYGQRTLDQLLVTLNVVEGGLPIFAFPPGTGDALGYGELAKRLKSYTFHAFNFIEAEIHLIVSEESENLFRDHRGLTTCSKSAWADVARGGLTTYQGHGKHGYMLHQSHLELNAALLQEILDQPWREQ